MQGPAHHAVIRPLGLLWPVIVPQACLVSDDLDRCEEAWVAVLAFFSGLHWVMGLGTKVTEVKRPARHIAPGT